ncbi:unnamed protein product [Sphagnum balticum]
MTPNQKAFLDMLAISELGAPLLAVSNNGYDVLVGSTAQKPLLFTSYDTHPNILNTDFDSTAAGRYQIIHPTFLGLCKQYGYTDFTPNTQDEMAIDLINGRGALQDIEDGNFASAVQKCSAEWASLPGGDSGQHENKLAVLQQAYIDAGGALS